jgi:hypothetical protein
MGEIGPLRSTAKAYAEHAVPTRRRDDHYVRSAAVSASALRDGEPQGLEFGCELSRAQQHGTEPLGRVAGYRAQRD